MKALALVAAAIALSAGVVVALAAIAGCGSSTPAPSKVVDCSARYGACVGTSANVEAYRVCRAQVDAVCLAEGGAP